LSRLTSAATHSEWEVLSADFAEDADEEKEICAIGVICGFPISHSALAIPHLNGSFPVFILGWTIGAIGG
jgi:hypothetical protein